MRYWCRCPWSPVGPSEASRDCVATSAWGHKRSLTTLRRPRPYSSPALSEAVSLQPSGRNNRSLSRSAMETENPQCPWAISGTSHSRLRYPAFGVCRSAVVGIAVVTTRWLSTARGVHRAADFDSDLDRSSLRALPTDAGQRNRSNDTRLQRNGGTSSPEDTDAARKRYLASSGVPDCARVCGPR